MAVVKELIRTEENGTISFGDYEKNQKSKVSDYPHQGDMYKVKTFKEITKLERNGMFVYESVPGTGTPVKEGWIFRYPDLPPQEPKTRGQCRPRVLCQVHLFSLSDVHLLSD